MNSVAAEPAGWREFATDHAPQVRSALVDSILPFWWRARDAERGGVFSCWDNAGTHLVSRDKFTWSQGRFIWLCARVSELIAQRQLPGDDAAWLVQSGRTWKFLRTHAILAGGRCAYRLSEDGAPLEAFPGSGPAPSVYADCFVAMGGAEFARVSGERAAFDEAWRLARNIRRLVAAADCPTWPSPIPPHYSAHGPWMILLNVALVLHRAAVKFDDPRENEARAMVSFAAKKILGDFMLPNGRIAEFRQRTAGEREETLLDRVSNPGHALEAAWLLFAAAKLGNRADWFKRIATAVTCAFDLGWDEVHDGLLHYADADRGEPRGVIGDTDCERRIRASWDTKLWWAHTEALVAAAASHFLTGDSAARAWFNRTWCYVWCTFPHPDPQIGEWIQIRDRRGAPLERVVALPVKDPYHIARNMLQLLEMFSSPKTAPLP